jgi:hypothetical protein
VQTLAIYCAFSDGGRYRSGDLSCGPALTDEAFWERSRKFIPGAIFN